MGREGVLALAATGLLLWGCADDGPRAPSTTDRARQLDGEASDGGSPRSSRGRRTQPDGGEPSRDPDARPVATADAGRPREATPAPDGTTEGESSAPRREPDRRGPAGVPTEVELVETGGLRLTRLILARIVEDRQPVDVSTSFSAADRGRIYAFVEVDNPERVETEIAFTWARTDDGEERGRVVVRVGGMPRWRTWAFTSVERHRGSMIAVVRDRDGRMLGRAPFAVTP